MPRNKDLKRLVRARMKKTGEAFTAARAQITTKRRNTARPAIPASASLEAVTARKDYAELAGMSDVVVRQKTGRDWREWTQVLDSEGAGSMRHGEIARLVSAKYEVQDWWSQMVTVGYERIKGLRARGQRLDGTYEASKSRTYDVPVSTLFAAFSNARVRSRWLDTPGVKVRTSTAPKSMRLGLADGAIVTVWFTTKGKSKSSVAVAQGKLRDRETATRLKLFWSERLDALGKVLAQG